MEITTPVHAPIVDKAASEQWKKVRDAMKTRIKQLSEQQRVLRPYRKLNPLEKNSPVPWQAASNMMLNKKELRMLHLGYGYHRGKKREQIEPKTRKETKVITDEQIKNVIEYYEKIIRNNTTGFVGS